MVVFRLIFTALFFFILPLQNNWAFGQSQSDLLQQFSKAEQNFHIKKYDESLPALNQLQPLLCESEIYDKCVESAVLKANIYRNKGEKELFKEQISYGFAMIADNNLNHHPTHPELYVQLSIFEREEANIQASENHVEKAEELINRHSINGITRARVAMAKGLNEDTRGNFETAIEYYNEVLNSVYDLDRTAEVINILAQVHNNMGISYRRLGDIDTAMHHYQTNLDLVKENFGENHLELSYAYNSIGTVYYTVGDYGTAGDFFLQAANIFRENLGDLSSQHASALNNAGVSFFGMNNLGRALELFEQSQRIKEQTLGTEHPGTAVGYANLARIYMQNGDHQQALKNARLSIDVRRNIFGDTHPDLVSPITQYGDFLAQINEHQKARDQYSKAISIVEASIGTNHPDIWNITIKKGASFENEKRLLEAKEHYSSAVYMMTGLSPDRLSANSDLSGLSHPFLYLDALKGLAETELRMFEDSNELSPLLRAFQLFEKASDTIDYLQFQYKSEASKLNLIDKNYHVYSNAIKSAYHLLKRTNDNRWLDEIIRFSELSRSRLALELIQEAEAKHFAGVPENILDQENHLNQKIAHHYQQLVHEQNKGNAGDLKLLSQHRDSLFIFKQNLEEYTQLLEERFPVYHQLKFSRNLIDREQAQQMLSENQTILTYIKGDDFWLAVLIDQNNTFVQYLQPEMDVKDSVETLRESTLNGETELLETQSRRLYDVLFKPVSRHINTKSVIIIPDESLYYLPFEMLLTEEPKKDVYYDKFPFLLRQYHISYAPSMTILDYMMRERNNNPRNLLALAPFNQSLDERSADLFTERTLNQLTPLPLTDYETREIAGLFKKKDSFLDYIFPETADILLHRDASKHNFLNRNLEQYGFLHFATHAFINESNPNLSGIALWGEEKSGILYVNDIYNMRFNADLAVLGACETGLGTLYRGEGVIGFTRAFIFAGVSNLAVSMWRVNDQPTSRLMISFYEKIRQGAGYSEALRMAKLELIEYPEFSEPKNWAAFVLHGF